MADHIQIGDVSPRTRLVGNGVMTEFSYTFPIFKDTDLEVYEGATLKTLSTDYSVSGAGATDGGKVIFVVAPASGVSVTMVRRLKIQRTTDFQESGTFRAKAINDALDYQTAALQQVTDDQSRSVQLSTSDAAANMTLPDKDTRAGRILSFDSIGGIALSSTDSLSLATLQAFTDWKVDTYTGDGSQVAFLLAAEPGQVGNTQVFWDGVYQSKSNYTVLGTELTFITAPPVGVNIEVMHGTASSTYVPDDGSIADVKIVDVGWSKVTGTPMTVAGYGITDFAANVTGAGAAMLGSNGSFTVDLLTTGALSVVSSSNAYHYIDRASTITEALTVFKTGGVIKAAVGLNNDATNNLEFFTGGDLATPKITVTSAGVTSFSQDFKVNNITGAAVNYIEVYGNVTTAPAVVAAVGSDSNISHYIDHKGTAGTYFRGAGATMQFSVTATTSAVNYPVVTGGTSGQGTVFSYNEGSGSVISHANYVKGGAAHFFYTAGISSGNLQFRISDTGSAVNYGTETGGFSGFGRQLRVEGADVNAPIDYSTKGAQSHCFHSHTRGALQFLVAPLASTVSYFQVMGGTAGSGPSLRVQSTEANAWALMYSKGAGGFQFYGNGDATQFRISPMASAVNHLEVSGATSGNGPTLQAVGTDAVMNFNFKTKMTSASGGQFAWFDSGSNQVMGMGKLGGGFPIMFMANATAPTSNPTGGGYLYVEAGALKYRGSSGNIQTLAIA